MTADEAVAALEALGAIPAWRADEPVRTFLNPFQNEENPETYAATGNVSVARNVEVAAGGYGWTPEEALDAMVKTARYLAGRHSR